MHSRTHTPRRLAAFVAAAAVAAAAIAIASPANAAEGDVTVSGGSLDWGYKESFRNYVSGAWNTSPGGIFAEDGATRSSAAANAGFLFPVSGGQITDADNLEITVTGTANFNAPSHYFQVKLSNVSIVVEQGAAFVYADTYLWAGIDFGTTPAGTHTDTDVKLVEFATTDVDLDTVAGTLTVSGTGGSITAEGAAANPLYTAGTVADGFSLTVDLDVEGPANPEEPEEPATGGEISVEVPQQSTEPGGSFGWEWASENPVSLGTATASGSNFVANGTLNDVVVTDSRTGGSYSWSLSGQSSTFVSGANSFSGGYLGWTPKVVSGTATAGAAVTSTQLAGAGLANAAVLASSAAATTATVGADLSLVIPGTTAAGDYKATLTITAVN